ncbi:MAG: RsmE family RNA methyltransferase [Myxococcota bacterium]
MSELWVFAEAFEASNPLVLSSDETRHLSARRLRVGDALVVFDGRWAEARLESIAKRGAVIDVGSINDEPRPPVSPMLASAIPKGDRLGTMLQMLTQLGLGIWQPLLLEDSAVRKLDPKAARLQRILIESAKLARRPWCLEVRSPETLEVVLAKMSQEAQICFGDREGDSSGIDSKVGLIVIGPEAGLSDSERRLLGEVSAQATSFGAHNLRIETAAVAAATAFNLAARSDSGVAAESQR